MQVSSTGSPDTVTFDLKLGTAHTKVMLSKSYIEGCLRLKGEVQQPIAELPLETILYLLESAKKVCERVNLEQTPSLPVRYEIHNPAGEKDIIWISYKAEERDDADLTLMRAKRETLQEEEAVLEGKREMEMPLVQKTNEKIGRLGEKIRALNERIETRSKEFDQLKLGQNKENASYQSSLLAKIGTELLQMVEKNEARDKKMKGLIAQNRDRIQALRAIQGRLEIIIRERIDLVSQIEERGGESHGR